MRYTYVHVYNKMDIFCVESCMASLLLTLGTHAHEGYSTQFVCICVRRFLDPQKVYTTL